MNPIDTIRFVHTAISVEAEALEHACAAASPADAKALGERVAMLARVVTGHTHGEEQSLFPALEERLPNVAATYLFDHEDERALFSAFAKAADAADTAAIRRLGVALHEHLVTHIRKENELILPLAAKLFTPPEQAGIVQKLLATIPPPEMLAAAGWMASRLPADDRVTWLEGVSKSAPPPVVAAIARSVKAALEPAAWGDLAARVPALGAAG